MDLNYFLKYTKRLSEKSRILNVNPQDLEIALEGEKVPSSIFSGFQTMTIELLKLFTSNKNYYEKFHEELIKKQNSTLTVRSEDEYGLAKEYDYNKFKIIDALEWAKDTKKLNKEEIEKLKLLKMSAEFKSFIDKYSNDDVATYIEGNYVVVPAKELIEFISQSQDDLYTKIEDGKVNNRTIEEELYALDIFLDENRIMDRYYIPEEVKKNIDILKDEVDIYYINRCLEYERNYLEKVEVKKSFKNKLLKNIPEEFNNLQKAYLVYYRMCNYLTYDEEQYAKRENKDYEIKHRDFKRIKTIDDKNNKIVCYEFNAIYAAMLKELGIKYELAGSFNYGNGHSDLLFRHDKYIVRADSTIGLIRSDLSYAKNGLLLKGFMLENKNNKTYNLFIDEIDEVNKYIAHNEPTKYKKNIKSLKVLDDFMFENVDLEGKATVFTKLVTSSDLPPIDKIPYQVRLRELLFKKENSDINRLNINFISYKEDEDRYSVMTLLSYNDNGVLEDPNNNKYIAIKSNGAIDYLDYNEVRYKLMNGTYKVPLHDDRSIPGFTKEESNGIFNDKVKKK